MIEQRLLVIDDDDAHREGMVLLLQDEGYSVHEADNARSAMQMIESSNYDLIVTDYKMQEIDGMQLLKMINDYDPLLKVIMVTGYSSIEHAVEAVHLGALDYIPKPVNPVKLKEVIARALAKPGISSGEQEKGSVPDRYIHFDEIIGKSKPLKQIIKRIQEISDIDVPVLVSGESGTGKELFARAIHKSSSRGRNNFVAVNTGAIAKDLILSELFGHEKGSFTGAVDRKHGKFEEAHGGTLFLDEISTMSEAVQIALLRVLESRVITRVGGSGEIAVDVRIIAATNRDLTRMIAEEKFRDDLYYRLNVYNIELPPLRDRGEDIMLIARSYLDKFNKEYNRNVKDIDENAEKIMQSYTWPGNIRELRNVVLRSMIDSKDLIRKKNLPEIMQKGGQPGQEIRFPAGTPLPEIERASIIETLKLSRGNKLKAADMLGLSRRSLYNKLEEYSIEENEYK